MIIKSKIKIPPCPTKTKITKTTKDVNHGLQKLINPQRSRSQLKNHVFDFLRKLKRDPVLARANQDISCLVAKDRGWSHWPEDEHNLLIEGLRLYGKDWNSVSKHVGSRNRMQCIGRAQYLR